MRSLRFAMLALFAGIAVCAFTHRCDAAVGALQLAGEPDSYFEVPANPSLDENLGSTFTIEAWVKPAPVLFYPANAEYMILNKEDSYEMSVRTAIDAGFGTFQVAVLPFGASWAWWDSAGAVMGGTWTHVAATWDGLMVRSFVNGQFLSASVNAAADGSKGVLNSTAASLLVGRRVRGNAALHSIFVGLITEIRISKVVRYTEAGFDPPTTQFASDADTVALYHFDTAVDGVVEDAGPLGNNGQLVQDAVLVPAIGIPITGP
jgi:Concanavalin A-like lectin/glucanases superfamily